MKRTLLPFILACALPRAAIAQAIHIETNNKAATPARGITTTESATEKLPADEATVTVRMMSSATHAPTQTQLQQIADAFVKVGVAAADVSKPAVIGMPGVAPSIASVSATLRHPTSDMLKRALDGATAATSSVEFPFAVTTVQLHAKNCGDAIDRARRAAIAKTRTKAVTIASEIGVRLGAIVALNDQEQSSADGSCTYDYGVGPAGSEFGGMAQPATDDYATLIVTSTVTTTYAIK